MLGMANGHGTFGTAAKILIVGGVFSLILAFVLGFILSAKRVQVPDGDYHYLLQAHKVSLQEGFMLLGLVFAVILSPLSTGVESTAAGLILASAAFQEASSITNWLQGTRDEFAERSLGLAFAIVNSVLVSAGVLILAVGVVKGLS